MRSISEKNEHALSFTVDPATGAGEACMTETRGRQIGPSGRFQRRSELPTNRAILFHARREVRLKQFASRWLKQHRSLSNELICHLKRFYSGRKKSCMSGLTSKEVAVAVMNLAPHQTVAPSIVLKLHSLARFTLERVAKL